MYSQVQIRVETMGAVALGPRNKRDPVSF
jgi:hypothetical protein